MDKYAIYGAMDRANIELHQVGMWLLKNEYIKSNPSALALAEEARETLWSLYQLLGEEFFKEQQ